MLKHVQLKHEQNPGSKVFINFHLTAFEGNSEVNWNDLKLAVADEPPLKMPLQWTKAVKEYINKY